MQQQKKKPLVLKADRLKVLTTTDLQQINGGTGIPPKLMTFVIRGLGG